MKVLVVFAALLTLQAPLPIPRQIAQDSAANSASKQQQSQKHPTSTSQPPAIIPNTSTNSSQDPSKNDTKQNNQTAIFVRELPTMSIEHDWLDYVSVGINSVLALIGICGVIYARKTLITLGRQTTATEIAANAAKDSANAVIGIERGWALIEKEVTATTHYDWSVANRGKTPVRIISVSWDLFAMGISDNLSLSAGYPRKGKELPEIIAPNGTYVFASFWVDQEFKTLWNQIIKQNNEATARMKAYFICCVLYKDVLNDSKIHETRYARIYEPPKGFSVFANPEYNRNT